MKNIYFYKLKDFNLLQYVIAEDSGAICGVFPSNLNNITKNFVIKETSLIKQAAKQLTEYFNKQRKAFDLPLKPEGTEFQLKVWKALQRIPYGETRSYGDIAAAIGNSKASRAVGMANNKNPIHIIIPCHRVIGANGNLTGYAGGLEIKQFLLEHEKETPCGVSI